MRTDSAASAAHAESVDPEIQASFGGVEYARMAVVAWESKRVDSAAKRLDVRLSGTGPEERRFELLAAKLDRGEGWIEQRLARGVRMADRVGRMTAIGRRRRPCVCRLTVPFGNARDFLGWFNEQVASSDTGSMLVACPDHFVFGRTPSGRQVVTEVTGGSPMPAKFTIDYSDISSLTTPPSGKYPHQIAGVARASNGAAIGGVRHQFRDVGGGFEAWLTVEFPILTMSRMTNEHSWHLACEFSNWIEAAFDRSETP
jgi:hypothetical protein